MTLTRMIYCLRYPEQVSKEDARDARIAASDRIEAEEKAINDLPYYRGK